MKIAINYYKDFDSRKANIEVFSNAENHNIFSQQVIKVSENLKDFSPEDFIDIEKGNKNRITLHFKNSMSINDIEFITDKFVNFIIKEIQLPAFK